MENKKISVNVNFTFNASINVMLHNLPADTLYTNIINMARKKALLADNNEFNIGEEVSIGNVNAYDEKGNEVPIYSPERLNVGLDIAVQDPLMENMANNI